MGITWIETRVPDAGALGSVAVQTHFIGSVPAKTRRADLCTVGTT